jgi:hypothetical protein
LELPPNNKYHTTRYTQHTSHTTPHHHHSNNNNTQKRHRITQTPTQRKTHSVSVPAPRGSLLTTTALLAPFDTRLYTARYTAYSTHKHCQIIDIFHRQPHHDCPHDHAAAALCSNTTVAVRLGCAAVAVTTRLSQPHVVCVCGWNSEMRPTPCSQTAQRGDVCCCCCRCCCRRLASCFQSAIRQKPTQQPAGCVTTIHIHGCGIGYKYKM